MFKTKISNVAIKEENTKKTEIMFDRHAKTT